MDQFKNFESLFAEAVKLGVIAIDTPNEPPPEKKEDYKYNKEAIYGLTLTMYSLKFNEWLIDSNKWDNESEEKYNEQLTMENFIQALRSEHVKYIEQLPQEKYIEFLKKDRERKIQRSDRAKVPEITESLHQNGFAHQKLPWKGTLKEFGELINQLEKNNWIDIPHGKLKPIVETLCSCFDFSATKKKKDSNTVNSLLQTLKPSEIDYKIYTKRYIKKFSSISINTIGN